MIRPKLGQLMFIGIQGTALSREERRFIIENKIGGIVLFKRNYESFEQLHALTSEIYGLKGDMPDQAPLFVGVDMEGGRVQRFKEPFTVWPAMRTLGDLDSPTLAFRVAESLGRELRAAGVNVDFAPSVDVLTNSQNTVIGDRALGSDPERVAKIGSALVRGFVKSGILACAKHFPGHGNTSIDSHEDLPIETLDLDRLRAVELPPFKRAFRARLELVMTCHVRFSSIDPDHPVTFSSKFINEVLRKELGYRGLVISDDLGMGALTKHFKITEIPVKALAAGVNLLCYCNEPETPAIALEAIQKAIESKQLQASHLEKSLDAIQKLKKSKLAGQTPMNLTEARAILDTPEHKMLAEALRTGIIPPELRSAMIEPT